MFKQYVKADYITAAKFNEENAIELMRKLGGSVSFKMDGTVREGFLYNYVINIGDLVTANGEIIRAGEGWESIND